MTIPSVLWLKSEGGGCECDEGLNGNETPGFNLDSNCLRAQSPGAGVDWESCCVRTTGVCMCVWAQVCVYTVYIWWDATQGKAVPYEGDPRVQEDGEGRPPASWLWRNEGDSHPPVREHSHLRPHLPTPFGISPPQGTLWPSLLSIWPSLLCTVPAASWNCHNSPQTRGHSRAL